MMNGIIESVGGIRALASRFYRFLHNLANQNLYLQSWVS
jgi:hypothetical protein